MRRKYGRRHRDASRAVLGICRQGNDMAVNIPPDRQICREPQTTFGMDTSGLR